MADERTLFAILENTDKSGLGLHKRAPGDAVSGTNEAPVVAAEDALGQFQHVPVRSEGNASGLGLPVLIGKDASGNLKYALFDTEGRLLVNDEESAGTKQYVRNTAVGVPGSDVDVATLSLSTSKSYNSIEWKVSSTQDTYWKLVQVNDTTETILDDLITGAGQYSIKIDLKNLSFTSGSTGTQSLKVVGNQLSHGKATSLYATIGAVEY